MEELIYEISIKFTAKEITENTYIDRLPLGELTIQELLSQVFLLLNDQYTEIRIIKVSIILL